MTKNHYQVARVSMLLACIVLYVDTAYGRDVHHSVPDLLTSFIPHSDRIVYETVETRRHRDTLRKHLGYVPERNRFVVFVALSGRNVDGYVVVDNENGRYDPITFGIKISADLQILACEVMVYRGPRGDEIRDRRFLEQFQGKSPGDRLTMAEIDIMTGATLSSKAAMKVVARALVLAQIVDRRLHTSVTIPKRPE